MKPKTIFHVDMDSFFVSVERLRDPSLEGKPVIVGGSPDGRGVVASASYEARSHGVHSAMPCAHARRLCPTAVFLSNNLGDYRQHSQRVAEVFESMTPAVQMAGLDEAYLDMTGTERLWGTPLQAAGKLRHSVSERTGLPCSVGIGSNRMIAKIASALCKPKGILWVPRGSEVSFMRNLPVRRIPGLGPKTQNRLRQLGIEKAGDLQDLGGEESRRALGNLGGELYERAMGRASDVVESKEETKSISNETTFHEDIGEADRLDSVLSYLSEKVGSRLRAQGFRAATIGIKFRYASFETHTATRTLSVATDDDRVIHRIARELLAERWNSAHALRLIGVCCSSLDGDRQQLDFLDAEAPAGRSRLLQAIDELRARHGFGSIRSAASEND